jgi:Rps23 Pro-64 3,4-dihydroxylase Tpa1-like proline 4-hydroxylase
MRLRKSLRELKFISAQMNTHSPILEEALYGFQTPDVVTQVGKITGLKNLDPDDQLYAGGISMMARGHFLNPHLDNSHDKGQDKYRVLNLLYYVSPSWKLENGGNLELWPQGPKKPQITVESKFNRLVVMITNSKSWHSVSPITVDENRCCVSNYYFSKFPAESTEYSHVTTFRGRPEQKIRNLMLQLDGSLRQGLRKIAPKGIFKVTHYYKKDTSDKKQS